MPPTHHRRPSSSLRPQSKLHQIISHKFLPAGIEVDPSSDPFSDRERLPLIRRRSRRFSGWSRWDSRSGGGGGGDSAADRRGGYGCPAGSGRCVIPQSFSRLNMWFSFWRSRKPFSLDELRYLIDQLQKVQIVNDINKDFVIEALRSIAELVTYGDQHDPSFFDFFMEKQIMGEFVRVLNISRPAQVAVQLLQTMSIMIQNLRSEHAIYYIFSNEHINYLITYSFDFKNDELVSYYISFLRTISGKLNKHTISLLVKTQNDEVVSFPLYTKAIQFSVNDEKMVRIAVRALTLNVYHVGDESVNKFVSQTPVSDYFSDVVSKFREDCIKLDGLVSQAAMNADLPDMPSKILSAVDEIEDTLYYFSDVISAGVPDLGRLITDNILQLLVFPLLAPSLKRKIHGAEIGITTSLYLLCCILRIVKTKELANTIATTLFFPPEAFIPKSEATANGYGPEHSDSQEHQHAGPHSVAMQADAGSSGASLLDIPGSSGCDSAYYSSSRSNSSHMTLRELVLSYIVSGDDIQVLGCLCLLSTLLQTKELEESMLDGLGILPQRKQHKKLLLQALVGEGSGEEQLFSSESSVVKDNILPEIDKYMQHLKDQYGLLVCLPEQGTNSQTERSQVLDALVSLFCRDDLSAETLWTGGWLLRQLLPNGEKEFTTDHFKQLKDSNNISTANMYGEAKGIWCDVLISVLIDEWGNCKRAMEAASPHKEPRSILLSSQDCPSGGESSFTAGERMCELVKIFVLQRQLLIFSCGGFLHDQPPVNSPVKSPENSRAKTAGLDVASPKPGTEINLDNALPCRIAFERGKERHFSFLAISRRTSGWILLAEELPLKQQHGVVRVTAPLAGSDPKIDDKHPKWLHLRIRPSSLPFRDPPRHDTFSKEKSKVLVDGRWTLAFRDAQSCKLAETMLIDEMQQQSGEVETRLKPFLDLDAPGCVPGSNISS